MGWCCIGSVCSLLGIYKKSINAFFLCSDEDYLNMYADSGVVHSKTNKPCSYNSNTMKNTNNGIQSPSDHDQQYRTSESESLV